MRNRNNANSFRATPMDVARARAALQRGALSVAELATYCDMESQIAADAVAQLHTAGEASFDAGTRCYRLINHGQKADMQS